MSHELGGIGMLAQIRAAYTPAPIPPSAPPSRSHSSTRSIERDDAPATDGFRGVDLLDRLQRRNSPAWMERDGNVSVPLTPIELPTPLRAIREGADMIRNWHPRDPERRVQGGRPRDEAGDPQATEGGERSGAAKAAMLIGIGGGLTANAIDMMRTIKKYPEAIRAGAHDPSLGRLGRLPMAVGLTALTRPDDRLIDPRVKGMAASAQTLGKSFDRFDDVAMKASVFLSASLSAIQIGASIPNLADAVDKDGPWHENLASTTSGRAGVLQLVGGSIGATVFGVALKQTKTPGLSGALPRVLAAGSAPIMARPVWTKVFIGQAALVMANELGYFDALNKGEERSTGETLADAAQRTPVINDGTWRSTALLGAGGITAFKAHRSVVQAGSIAGMGKGPVIGGAIVAGLLGAQLLGGLASMDKPVDD